MHRRHIAVPLYKAMQESPTLSTLAKRLIESAERLDAIATALPDGLRSHVKAGPLDGEKWCLVVTNTSVASKLKHLVPVFQATLLAKGFKVSEIRFKVQGQPKS